MASVWTRQLHSISFSLISLDALELRRTQLVFHCCYPNSSNGRKTLKKFVLNALRDENNGKTIKLEKDKVFVDTQNVIAKFQESVSSLPLVSVTKRTLAPNIAIGVCIAMLLVILLRIKKAKNSRSSPPGSVADLVRRGQLRSDRRGISNPHKYEDPFNNPMVKIGTANSTVEMCGKVYRLAPVTLTREQQTVHMKRRSRAYQWKRPTIFLKEGDAVPPDVDPDTIRWIPANHPFATTISDINEDLAQTNVYQKHGVPFRVKAEHEALQKKLESLQNDQKFSKLAIDPAAAKNFERPYKLQSKTDDQVERKPSNGQSWRKSDHTRNSVGNNTDSEDTQLA